MQEKAKGMREETRNADRGAEHAAVWRKRICQGVGEVLWVGCAWLFGQAPMLFGTYPLGLALLCASSSHTLSILIGLIISALWQMSDPTVYICTYAAAALVRVAASLLLDPPEMRMGLPAALQAKLRSEATSDGTDRKNRFLRIRRRLREDEADGETLSLRATLLGVFTESVCLRMCTAGVCSFIVSLYRIIVGGFRYYDLFAAVFVLLLTPLAVMVYSVSLGGHVEHRVLRKISQATLLFSLIWAADGIAVAGISLSVMLALFFTLYICVSQGSAMGVGAGILCGIAYDPLYAPAFLLAALIFSLVKTLKNEGAGVLFASLGALIWSVYVGGAEILFTMLPACLVAGTVFTVYTRFRTPDSEPEAETDDSSVRLRMEGARRQDSNDRFRGISDAFSSLSEMFYNLSDRFRRPGTLDLRHICDRSFDTFCADCPNKTVCWGLEYSNTLGTVNGLISALHTKGKVTRAQIPQSLAHRCESADAILETINRECAKLTGEMLRNNRTEIFAMDYESAASIINDALEEDDGEYRFDPELEQKISDYLKDAGVRAHGVTVYGNRRRQILVRGVDVEQANVTLETLRADLGELCGLELSHPVFEVEGNISTMTLQAKKKISVAGAQNNVSADGGVSGDSVNLFSNKKDYFYALINDGMGAGKEAALTSNLCSVFLEKMLRAGNRAGTSLRMLNNMIRSRGADSSRECSSTVDLMELDLMTAKAVFIKSGAAPSFVVRGKVVQRLQAGTAPIGIICALDVQSTPFHLKAGDTVVMISDGILQNDPDCNWITSYLSTVSDLSPEEIVYHICLHAAESDRHDDCSAIAVRIRNAEE